jgi:predicted transcriptional regulator
MRLAVMIVPSESSHNANLPVTIAPNGRIVNAITNPVIEDGYDLDIVEDAKESVFDDWDKLTREHQASVLFVKIDNSIFNFNLKPKVIELYILLAYIIMAKPKFRFSYRGICDEYLRLTRRSIDKDTVNLYVQILISKNLLKKGKNKNYILGTNLDLLVTYTQNSHPQLDWGSKQQNNSIPESSKSEDFESNYYQVPKNRYTPFYIKIYLDNLTKNEVVLDHYIASLAYKNLRPSKVTKEVNISLSTYFKLLRSLRAKNIIYRSYIFNKNIKYKKMYFYYSIKRDHLLKDYENDKIYRWIDKRDEVLEAIHRPKKHKSKYWFVGEMGDKMKKYGIKYVSLFDNYNLQDALDIIKELELQNQKSTKYMKLNAAIVVKAIKEAWNWDRIVARRHDEFRRVNSPLKYN